MTREEAIDMLKAKLKCMEREESGLDMECNSGYCANCDLCYRQGNWGEQKEYLELSIEALKQPEIVYCKDCSYKNDEYQCPFYYMGYRCKDYNYCSFAERKDD